MQEWLKLAEKWVADAWGVSPIFARKLALFLAYLYLYNLNPRITSGLRDLAKQMALQAAWDAGNRAGLRARPATNSLHLKGLAVDIVTNNQALADQIARALGLGVGSDYTDPDPGHYYLI